MAYPYHYLFSFGGTLLGGTEIWTNNIRFVATGSPSEEYDQQDIAEGLLQVMADGFALTGAASLGYSTRVTLRWGKFNAIGPDGKYADPSQTYRADLNTPGVSGHAPPGTNVPQVAMAVSWGTARERGRASKGRIYVPMPIPAPTTTGRLATNDRDNHAAAWAAQIDRLNDRAQGTLQELPIAAVVSGVDASYEPIRTVRVGDVLDTQRSRRNALVESYATATVPDVQ